MRRLAIGISLGAAAVAGLAVNGGAGSAAGDDGATSEPAIAETAAPTTAGATTDDAAEGASSGDDETAGRVRVLQVSGLFNDIVVDSIHDALDRSAADGDVALILQVDSRGSVVGDEAMAELLTAVDQSTVPVAVWVGPTGASLHGTPAQLLAVAHVSTMAERTTVGYLGAPLSIDGTPIDLGDADPALRSRSANLAEARELGLLNERANADGTIDNSVETIRNVVDQLNGLEHDGAVLRTTTATVDENGAVHREHVVTVVMTKLTLVDQLFHTVASPAMAYLLLLIGLALLIFEFYTAGVGVAGVVGAGSLILAATGLAALPTRPWALAVIVLSMLAYAVDVQVGIPRFWTAVGTVGLIVGSLFLFDSVPGNSMRLGWLTLLAGIGGIVTVFTAGMPSMVRTRFATPTIGREWMIGELGTVVTDVAPDGVVNVRDAEWRAHTNRATPVGAGEQIRVVAIDGVTLEVEPLEGAARDYRERRGRASDDADGSDGSDGPAASEQPEGSHAAASADSAPADA